MKLSIFFIVLLFAFAFSHADTIAPTLISQDDQQDPSLPSFVFSFSVNCVNSTGIFYVFDENLTPVSNVSSYLSYIDYSTPLLSRSSSDQNGKIIHNLVGKTIFMRGMFVWYLTKEGYRPKEVHFDIRKCFENQTSIPLPNYTPSVSTPQSSSILMSEPKYWTNTTENPDSSKEVDSKNTCPLSLFFLIFISIGLKNH